MYVRAIVRAQALKRLPHYLAFLGLAQACIVLDLQKAYQEPIKSLSRAYQEPIKSLSRAYQEPIKSLSRTYQEPEGLPVPVRIKSLRAYWLCTGAINSLEDSNV
jgi:hypothetical protein